MSQTVLVTGVNGQLGWELLRSLQGLGRVVGVDRKQLDLSDPDQIRAMVRSINPQLIVNPAAYTAVDNAEKEPELAYRINAIAPQVLAEEALRIGVPLIHYSTDYVFDGTKATPYVESDATNPQNVYGASKLAGEQAIAATGCVHLIFRTSWVYGARGKNFMLTIQRLARERPELRIVADQFGAPTWCRSIAELTAQIAAQGVVVSRSQPDWWKTVSGIYNLTNGGRTSWHGFAQAIVDGMTLDPVPRITPIPADQYPVPAKRPGNSSLDGSKLLETFGLAAPGWEQALQLCCAAA